MLTRFGAAVATPDDTVNALGLGELKLRPAGAFLFADPTPRIAILAVVQMLALVVRVAAIGIGVGDGDLGIESDVVRRGVEDFEFINARLS